MKKYSLTVIRPSDVIEEQAMSMIKGGCLIKLNCNLEICKPNTVTPSQPTDTIPTKPKP